MFVFFIVFALYVFVLFGCCFCLAYVYLFYFLIILFGVGVGVSFQVCLVALCCLVRLYFSLSSSCILSLVSCILLLGIFPVFINFAVRI